jgi:hypothetical protein
MVKRQILKQETPVSQVLNRYKNELTKNIERQIPIPNFSLISEESKQEASISQIIRTYGKYFKQIRQQYTDGLGGRCVMSLIMSYYGWDCKCITNAELNDSGATFEDIADYLDRNLRLASSNR